MRREKSGEKVVEFENTNTIKKKAVRGLLRKRAKKYTEKPDSESEEESKSIKKKKTQLKSSFATAFKSVMGKQI